MNNESKNDQPNESLNTIINEMVMVVPKKSLFSRGYFQGILTGTLCDHFMANLFCLPDNLMYLSRRTTENSLMFKQLIPYVVIKQGAHVLTYLRGESSGEQRLVGKISIGIGGHVNPPKISCATPWGDFLHSLEREVVEELGRLPNLIKSRILGVVNEDYTETGRAHFGIVFLWEVQDMDCVSGEDCIEKVQFQSIPQLYDQVKKGANAEEWAKLVLIYLMEENFFSELI